MKKMLNRTEEEWELYLYNTLTHPVTTRRLELMAFYLYQTADRAGGAAERETLRYIASRLMAIIEILEDIDLQGCMAVVASRADPSSLRPRHPGETTGGSLMEKWCSSAR